MTKKVMSDYSCFCTEEQTKKALELGAPIEFETECPYDWEQGKRSPYPDVKVGKDGEPIFILPTAEQMRGWLMEKLNATIFTNKYYPYQKGFGFLIIGDKCVINYFAINNGKDLLKSDKEATLAAIDAALEYLSNNKK